MFHINLGSFQLLFPEIFFLFISLFPLPFGHHACWYICVPQISEVLFTSLHYFFFLLLRLDNLNWHIFRYADSVFYLFKSVDDVLYQFVFLSVIVLFNLDSLFGSFLYFLFFFDSLYYVRHYSHFHLIFLDMVSFSYLYTYYLFNSTGV
jgi:hypothetical protein